VCDLLEEQGATPDELIHGGAPARRRRGVPRRPPAPDLGAAFRVVEKRLEAVIEERFALPDASARVKPLDRALLATERRIFSTVSWAWPELDGVEPLDLEIEPWLPDRAREEFTRRYERLEALR
jgi:hypothetical protein